MKMATIAKLHSSLATIHFHSLSFHFPLSHSFPTTLNFNSSLNSSLPPASLRSPLLPIPRSHLPPKSSSHDASSGTKVATVDFSLALKKKAMDVSPELKGTSIFLVGLNNSMKSRLGELLAELLRYYYFDSDGLVSEAAGGESAAKSLRESDEKGFQESETEVLKQLSSLGRLVVCAGNGAVQSSTNLALLRHGISIWIDVPLDMVAKGITENERQSSLLEISTSESYSEVFSQLADLYEKTRSGYATADATVSLQEVACQLGYDDLDAVTIEDMAMEVLKEIQRLTRVKQMLEEAAKPF